MTQLFSSDAERTAETARLNDLARKAPRMVNASWLATGGVAALLAEGSVEEDRGQVMALALARYASFDEGDDPYGERDFGVLELWGERLFWKIDYYHPDRDEHSPLKWSTELTRRVVTIMLASEY
ncbi:hypothetical protein CFHF_18555 [Caulobacter flavus]|jgi:hypothetical protein|uniref:DUF3768 domain-containing protein n=1 Tax=Caulobacter flavus TaxID=1679497 RepID=A0A2N5CPR2_9CAUL|nr:DUF3768 domain-containing protein [Caulobacter flavus]PLR09144.1 hypothetical protein CFHF_18555 [Caulobacter flavus]